MQFGMSFGISNFPEKLKINDVTLEQFNSLKPTIKDYLIHHQYIKRQPLSIGESYVLTEKGKKFVSFEETNKAEKRTEKAKKIESFPKRYWWLMTILGGIIGLLIPTAQEMLKQRILPASNQSQPYTPQIIDTLR